MNFEPIEGNPFEKTTIKQKPKVNRSMQQQKFIPVEGNPFAADYTEESTTSIAPSSTATSIIDDMKEALAKIESGGHPKPYEARNPKSSARGKYQILKDTWDWWNRKYFNKPGKEIEWSVENQENLVTERLKDLYENQKWNPRRIFRSWYGHPNPEENKKYADKVMAELNKIREARKQTSKPLEKISSVEAPKITQEKTQKKKILPYIPGIETGIPYMSGFGMETEMPKIKDTETKAIPINESMQKWASDWKKYLESPTKPPKNIKDFIARVVPESANKTMYGFARMPYDVVKKITDAAINEGRMPEAWRDFILPTAEGFARFAGEPLGVYGTERAKERWTTDPFGSLLGVLPLAVGGAGYIRGRGGPKTSPPGDVGTPLPKIELPPEMPKPPFRNFPEVKEYIPKMTDEIASEFLKNREILLQRQSELNKLIEEARAKGDTTSANSLLDEQAIIANDAQLYNEAVNTYKKGITKANVKVEQVGEKAFQPQNQEEMNEAMQLIKDGKSEAEVKSIIESKRQLEKGAKLPKTEESKKIKLVKTKKTKVSDKPVTDFVRKNGGINLEYLPGEVERISNKELKTTGLVKKKGIALDKMRERLEEEGLLPPNSTPADVIEAIEAEFGKKKPKVEEPSGFDVMEGEVPESEIPQKSVPASSLKPGDKVMRYGEEHTVKVDPDDPNQLIIKNGGTAVIGKNESLNIDIDQSGIKKPKEPVSEYEQLQKQIKQEEAFQTKRSKQQQDVDTIEGGLFNPLDNPQEVGQQTIFQRLKEQEIRDNNLRLDSLYQGLMKALEGELQGKLSALSKEDAQIMLDRLNKAPGDNPAVRKGLENILSKKSGGPDLSMLGTKPVADLVRSMFSVMSGRSPKEFLDMMRSAGMIVDKYQKGSLIPPKTARPIINMDEPILQKDVRITAGSPHNVFENAFGQKNNPSYDHQSANMTMRNNINEGMKWRRDILKNVKNDSELVIKTLTPLFEKFKPIIEKAHKLRNRIENLTEQIRFTKSAEEKMKFEAKRDRAVSELESIYPDIDQLYNERTKLMTELAKKSSDVRIALAAEGKLPEGISLAPGEARKVELIKKFFEEKGEAMKEVGLPVIEGEYVTHVMSPIIDSLIKRRGLFGRRTVKETMAMASRLPNSETWLPSINLILDQYIPDINRRIAFEPFVKKWGAVTNELPVTSNVRKYLKEWMDDLMYRKEDKFLDKALNAYRSFEYARLIGFKPSVSYKHLYKIFGTLFKHGAMDFSEGMYRTAKVPVQKAMSRLGIKGKYVEKQLYDSFLYSKALVKAMDDSPTVKGFINDNIRKILSNPTLAVEALDNGVSLFASIKKARRKGLSPEDALAGIWQTILDVNLRGAADLPMWQRGTGAQMMTMFQMTPIKLNEFRWKIIKNAFEGKKDIFGTHYGTMLIRTLVGFGVLSQMLGRKHVAEMMFHLPFTGKTDTGELTYGGTPWLDILHDARHKGMQTAIQKYLKYWGTPTEILNIMGKKTPISTGKIPRKYGREVPRYLLKIPKEKGEMSGFR